MSREPQVAIVTGGGSGLGRAAALRLGRLNCAVAVWDLDADAASSAASAIVEAGGRALGLGVDVRDDAAVEAATAASIAELGELTVAFNNAGIGLPVGPLAAIALEDFDRVVATNLRGVFSCMRHQIPRMLEGGGGRIVNCSSVAGQVGLGGESAYTATKHGVIGLTKAAAIEYGGDGLLVNAICPGAVRTRLLDTLAAGGISEEDLLSLHHVGRLGEPSDIAETVSWLLLEAPSFISGTTLNVDGGWTA